MTISRLKKSAFILIGSLMTAFTIYVTWFAPRYVKVFLGVWNIDKLFHVSGGIFIAIFFEWLSPRHSLSHLLLLVGFLAVGWESWEVVFLPDVIYFAHHSPDLWRIDTAGDIVAAFLGGYGYWVFAFDRGNARIATPISAD